MQIRASGCGPCSRPPTARPTPGHQQTADQFLPGPGISDPEDLKAALETFRQAAQRPYYDETGDQLRSRAYYGDLVERLDTLSPSQLYQELSQKISRTHTRELPYRPSLHLYPWVDLHPDLSLQSIYSGHRMDAISAIRSDYYQELAMQDQLGRMAATAHLSPERAAAQIALTQSQYTLNCEHVVPQSWYAKANPMRGDLHHLYACESRCNSYRGNRAYQEISDYGQDEMQACGMISPDKRHFEPEANKGVVARATLYFLLRYPHKARDYSAEDIKTLLRWHEGQSVTLYERHRNAAIETEQGNRNPLIDHPEWASRIDFRAGVR